jgi:DNA recombination protein RmuC
MKAHLASVRAHISGLSKAGYNHLPGIATPDFVVMFVPVEPAFLLALQNDSDLWSDAYRQGVLLVGPTTLLYIIRIINVLWDQDKQTRNVTDVMERGARLYEKFAAFINDMEDLGKCLRGATQSYEEAKKKLGEGPGNLVRQVEMLRELGVKPKFSKKAKPIPIGWLASSGIEEEDLTLAAVEANEASDID